MRLIHINEYEHRGLDNQAIGRLSLLGDLLLSAGFNVTGIKEEQEIERVHFLDSLSLFDLEIVVTARTAVDIGSGAGLPALVIALARPDMAVTAVESQRKKCHFIVHAAKLLGLSNLRVCCERAEEHGRGPYRETYDVAVSRAVGPLPVVAEYSVPLLRLHGYMVAMKGSVSNEERIQVQRALDILGAGKIHSQRVHSFPGAENRWVYVAEKMAPTPGRFPRRPGLPSKRPLGGVRRAAGGLPGRGSE